MYKLISEEIEVDVGERDIIIVLTNGEEHTVTVQGYARSYRAPVEIPDRPFPQDLLEMWYKAPEELKIHALHVKDRNPLELIYSGDKTFAALNADKTTFVNRNLIAKVKVGEVFDKKIKVTQCKVVKVEQV